MKKTILIGLAVAALVGSCGGSEIGNVSMVPGRRFDPGTLTIQAGETVTWTNESDDSHTVTAVQEFLPRGAPYFASGGFDDEAEAQANLTEGLLTNGETFRFTFEEPGTYEYYCIPHRNDGMQGKIIVK